jgi:hypothetical protein
VRQIVSEALIERRIQVAERSATTHAAGNPASSCARKINICLTTSHKWLSTHT